MPWILNSQTNLSPWPLNNPISNSRKTSNPTEASLMMFRPRLLASLLWIAMAKILKKITLGLKIKTHAMEAHPSSNPKISQEVSFQVLGQITATFSTKFKDWTNLTSSSHRTLLEIKWWATNMGSISKTNSKISDRLRTTKLTARVNLTWVQSWWVAHSIREQQQEVHLLVTCTTTPKTTR